MYFLGRHSQGFLSSSLISLEEARQHGYLKPAAWPANVLEAALSNLGLRDSVKLERKVVIGSGHKSDRGGNERFPVWGRFLLLFQDPLSLSGCVCLHSPNSSPGSGFLLLNRLQPPDSVPVCPACDLQHLFISQALHLCPQVQPLYCFNHQGTGGHCKCGS